jgi:CheY-like chemotaxis protein
VSSEQKSVLLLVEDDPEMRSLLCDELWDLNVRIVEARDGDEALEQASAHPPDLILTDLRMPAGGLDYISRLGVIAPKSPIILMTAFGDAQTRDAALKAGVKLYFDKPVRMKDLKQAIKSMFTDNHDNRGIPST